MGITSEHFQTISPRRHYLICLQFVGHIGAANILTYQTLCEIRSYRGFDSVNRSASHTHAACDVSQEHSYVGTFHGNVQQACKVTCINYEGKQLSARAHTQQTAQDHKLYPRGPGCAALSPCDQKKKITNDPVQTASIWVKTLALHTFACETDKADGWHGANRKVRRVIQIIFKPGMCADIFPLGYVL